MKLSPPGAQQGAILIVSLIILLVLTIIGALTLKTGTLQELMAGNAQLVSTNRQAAQTASNSFVSEATVVYDDYLPNSANQGAQILRKAISRRQAGTNATDTANAIVHCVTSSGESTEVTTVSGKPCTGAANSFSAAGAPTKARRRVFYMGCAAALCGPGMATSMDIPVTLGCPNFYVEGSGYLDVDGNGMPPAVGNEEAAVFEHEWARWKRPIPCE